MDVFYLPSPKWSSHSVLKMAKPIKAGTFNILNSTDWYDARRPLIIRTISRMDCDVIGFQEVNFEVNGPDLQSLEGYTYHQGESANPILKPEFADFRIDGNAALIKSDLAVENTETLIFDSQNRCALILTLSRSTHRFVFVVTHLEWYDAQVRAAQVTQLLAHLEKYSDIPVVISGDFNTYPDSEDYAQMSRKYRSAYLEAEGQEPVITFPTGLTSPGIMVIRAGTVDYIWIKGQVSAVAGQLLTDFDHEGIFASDHYAVRVDLRLS